MRVARILPVTAIFLLGCVSEEVAGGAHVYRYAGWVPLVAVLAAAAALGAAWVLRDANRPVAGGLAAAALGALVLLPAPMGQSVTVSDEGFGCVSGPWWSRHRQEVRFEDLREIRFVTERDEDSLGEETSYRRLLCLTWSDEEIRIPRGELVARAETRILAAAGEAGVDVTGGR